MRAISGLSILTITFYSIHIGGRLLTFYIFLLSIIAINEFYDAVSMINIKPIRLIGYIGCVGFFLNSLELKWVTLTYIVMFVLIGLIIALIVNKKFKLKDAIITFFSIFYIPFLMQHIIYLDDKIYVLLTFIIAWGTDTFAYVFGSLFGKHKLSPKLSPKKTIEGSIGGILGAAILTYYLAKYFEMKPIWIFMIISSIGSIIGQIGDLTASKIKRLTGIKDFGFIMPGHGGVLDRFDSILFVAPYIYFVLNYFLQ